MIIDNLIRGRGGIGRLIGFRFQRVSVQVRVLSPAPIKRGHSASFFIGAGGRLEPINCNSPVDCCLPPAGWRQLHTRRSRGHRVLSPASIEYCSNGVSLFLVLARTRTYQMQMPGGHLLAAASGGNSLRGGAEAIESWRPDCYGHGRTRSLLNPFWSTSLHRSPGPASGRRGRPRDPEHRSHRCPSSSTIPL